MRIPDAEIEAAKTVRGGWTRETLARWGVPWPPPKGWRTKLTTEELEIPTAMNIDLFDPKTQGRFRELAKLVQEARALGVNHGTALADAIAALKRQIKRAIVPEGMERFELTQDRGPTIEFTGRQIADTSFQTRGMDPMNVTFTIYETEGGALVGMRESEPAERSGFVSVRVHIVEASDDPAAMRREIMDLFGWDDRARAMFKKLGWTLRQELA